MRWAGLLLALVGLVAVTLLGGSTGADAPAPEDAAGSPSPQPSEPLVACDGEQPPPADPRTYDRRPPMRLKSGVDYQAILETSCGRLTMDLLEDEAPETVNNFVFLAEDGFYDGLTFHRVERNSVIQGGDPQGTGRGGPGYTIPDEFPSSPNEYVFGTVAMANEGPGTAGSQFFIVVHDPDPDANEEFERCTASQEVCVQRRRAARRDARVDEPAGYRPDYAIFAKLDPEDDESVETLLDISQVETKISDDPTIATQPIAPIYIESIEILER